MAETNKNVMVSKIALKPGGQTQGEDQWEIPLRILLLYSEIEKNGSIELKALVSTQ